MRKHKDIKIPKKMSHSDDTMGQIVKNMQAANVKLKKKNL